ncbi:uncharacterized protein DS421_3g77750 [Arachis hypogaea]|nr:uncharacterized protein DS421_3g77750 [Arachis hypogaea]
MVSVAFPIHRPPIFHVDKIREWNWAKHVLNFLMKGVENKREGNKQSVDGCVFVLMLIYFHETKFPRPFAPDAPPAPWVTYWTREKIIERISSETTQPLRRRNKKNHNKKRKQPLKVVKKQTKKTKHKTSIIKRRKQPERAAKTPTQLEKETEQEKDNAAEKRKRALEIIMEKRSKKRNDGPQSTNIAPDQFDSPQGQNDSSQTVPTVNIDSEQVLQTQGSSTPSVDAASNTSFSMCKFLFFKTNSNYFNYSTLTLFLFTFLIPPLALSLPSSVQEELMKDDFMYVPPQEETQQTPNNDCPQEAEMHGVIVSLTSSVIEGLMKDDYVYEVSNEDPAKEQEQQAQELTVQQESEQEAPVNVPAKEQEQQAQEPPVQQESEQEALVNICLLEPNKQGVTGSITSSVLEQFFKDADVYQVSDEEQSKEPLVARHLEKETLILSSFDSAAQPRESEDERPSFSLGISSPASQPTQPS